ncbi:transport protein particle component [Polychaeton citri CBS 116435]|uniref:Transport protein particle component n=1 Tax=Polychaeton citri CBS 116435 TaxID=1314669 RepID=A0A9P4UK46_9PEZI|nr:transport protein particle component [Polychaeton citri CBS 116435]
MSTKPQPQYEPTDQLVAASCLDFLLIELVPLAQRITEQLLSRDRALIEARKSSYIFNNSGSSANKGPLPLRQQTDASKEDASSRDSTSVARDSMIASTTGAARTAAAGQSSAEPVSDMDRLGGLMDDDETRDAAWYRLEQMGYRVGQGLAERFSANKPRPQTPLDCIKFLCKDFWLLMYRKPIDNLKTNHRGIFVLTDVRFYPLSRMSIDTRTAIRASNETLQRAQSYLVFPSGLIRGVLQGLGVECTVVSETADILGARFEIRVKGAKP